MYQTFDEWLDHWREMIDLWARQLDCIDLDISVPDVELEDIPDITFSVPDVELEDIPDVVLEPIACPALDDMLERENAEAVAVMESFTRI